MKEPVKDDDRWRRLTELFDRLLSAQAPDQILASEADPEIRNAAASLWRHHVRASGENYLGAGMEFEITPVFQAGEILLNRFRIESLLGTGGMGEVYLAWDSRMESRVALKTIARLLGPSESIRKRFIAEVQNARRVTHPNICRIHELFEDGGRVFFSMEYLDGVPLSEYRARTVSVTHRRLLLRQLAEGLHAAHRTGVVHGDFKPFNVMILGSGPDCRAVIMDFGLARALDRAILGADENLSVQAGSGKYMAPELVNGSAPSIRSDIYAFGMAGRELLPKERIWDRCTRPNPDERVESLQPVIERLKPRSSRRALLGSLTLASVGGSLYVWRAWRPRIVLPMGARIAVNGFRSAIDQNSRARLVRSLLLVSLEHSALVHAVADEDLLPALRRLRPGANLPIEGHLLGDLLASVRADFWVGGELRSTAGAFSLALSLMKAEKTIARTVIRGLPGAMALAEAGALWLRETAGESQAALGGNQGGIGSYTSRVPEALERYCEAMDRYALGDMDLAAPLLREALLLDPNFAQAHHILALVLNSLRQYDEGFREIEIALRLSRGLPERERIEIEMNHARMTGDPVRIIELAKRNVALHPDEARAQASFGQAQMNLGNFDAGVSALREAVRLAPDDWMNAQLLVAGLVEAGRFDQALDEFQKAQVRGLNNRWLYNGAGYAYLGMERYGDAISQFASEPLDSMNAADVASGKILQGHLEAAIAAMEQQRARAANQIEAHRANEFLCGLYFVTGRLAEARRIVRDMVNLAPYPPMAMRLTASASWARRVGDGETLEKVRALAAEIAGKWPNPQIRAVEAHANALQAWGRNDLAHAADLLVEASAPSLNIQMLFDAAELYTRWGNSERAETFWEQFEAHRGTIFVKGWFPGILPLSWLYRAMAARSRNDRATAFLYSKKVLDLWSLPHLEIVRTAEILNLSAKPN